MRSGNHQETERRVNLLRIMLLITILLNSYALIVLFNNTETGFLQFNSVFFHFITILGFGVLTLGCIILGITWTRWREKIYRTSDSVLSILSRLRIVNLLLFALCISFYSFIILGPYGGLAKNLSIRIFLFWLLILVCSFLLKAYSIYKIDKFPKNWVTLLMISIIIAAFCYKISFYFQNISFYPFTLTWSETSRYYYASLFLANRIYGTSLSPTVLHPTRYLMQAVPFLLPESPLWLHRSWQVFLYIGTPFLTAWILVRRLTNTSQLRNRLLILWISIFIYLGPVYYHLLIPVMIILWGFNNAHNGSKRFPLILSFLSIIVASAWAGISRLNWFPMPGLLASTLFLLETPITNPSDQGRIKLDTIFNWKVLRYALNPILWTLLGTTVAFASQALFISLSGNQLNEFTSSLSSDLLWHRLLPNPTYAPGILPAALIVSLPLLIIILSKLAQKKNKFANWRCYHPIRYLGLTSILTILFLGGLVVSVKIGGGSNLHNLDAYLTILLVISIYFYLDKTTPDIQQRLPKTTPDTNRANREIIQGIGIALALIIPAILTIASGNPAPTPPNRELIEKSMQTVREYSNHVVQSGDEVLFISNRHLITFGYLDDIPMVPEYERVFLMEMAMANNANYLGQFQDDIKNHRFALIISEPLSKSQKKDDDAFGAENNAWTKRVSSYILCYYKPEKTFRQTQIQLLAPNPKSEKCP